MYVCTAETPRRRLECEEGEQHQQDNQAAVIRISRKDVAITPAHAASVIQQVAELVATSRLR